MNRSEQVSANARHMVKLAATWSLFIYLFALAREPHHEGMLAQPS
jgi:hypothetical protein